MELFFSKIADLHLQENSHFCLFYAKYFNQKSTLTSLGQQIQNLPEWMLQIYPYLCGYLTFIISTISYLQEPLLS